MTLGKWYKLQGTNIAYPYAYYATEEAVWIVYQRLSGDWNKTATTNVRAPEVKRLDNLYPFFQAIFK